MRSRDAIGRKIVAIEQRRFKCNVRGWITEVQAIVLDNGTRLVPNPIETEDTPVADILVVKPERKPE